MSTVDVEIKAIKVLIGQVHLCRPPHLLQSVLGSCIGLAIYDPDARIAGMAHVLLPESGGRPRGALPGKYGDHAVECLIEGLLAHGAARARLRAKIAGGARMFDHALDYRRDVGAANVAAVEAALAQGGVPLQARHVGGGLGRRVEFCPATLAYVVEDFAAHRTVL